MGQIQFEYAGAKHARPIERIDGLLSYPALRYLWALRGKAQSGCFRLNSEFTDAFSQLRELRAAFLSKHYESGKGAALFRQFPQRLAEKAKAMPVHTSELAIGAADMDGCMPSGLTGDFWNRLLRKTQTGELKNSRPELLEHLHGILPQSNFSIRQFPKILWARRRRSLAGYFGSAWPKGHVRPEPCRMF
ncbi:MAG: hypothetical protein LBO03_06400 [Acidaminococcales bacterium]|jgi:hypothetical protein|nr:hypothetical protein [Acidaminococcales bacterium]